MGSMQRLQTIAGWLVFAVALTVYFFSAERTGSLWDCGEFILGAYKLQVVHPPGAPLFVLIGRLFTWVAEIVSDNPEDIAFSVNLMSSICTAFTAMFICWVTIMLGKLALVGRENETSSGQAIALAGAGVVGGLATAFCTSIWFSAVEGEVYAMSTFFTAFTLWSMIKWYSLPDTPQSDRWLLFTVYIAGLSVGVHLLSLLTFPALAMFYYFKKYKEHTLLGMGISAGVGVLLIVAIQKLIIVGIPTIWGWFEIFMVNNLGMPFHSGLIPTFLIFGGLIFFGLRYAHQKQSALVQHLVLGATVLVIAFSTIGVVVIRANAAPPINMNNPSDATRLLPYLNREQYGERPLLRGPHFEGKPTNFEVEERYGRVEDRYEIVDQKLSYVYDNRDKMLFPRMGDYTQGRPGLYKAWMGLDQSRPLPPGRPNQGDNIGFLFSYQIGWMYFRYFMWNFSGRQNGEQGMEPWDKSSGHWISGIPFIDSWRLGNQSELTDTMLNHKARNKYYMLPLIFGLIGLFFHYRRRPNDFLGLLALFIITGIGIIIYSNQPPREPRERDYVLVGSFFTFCIWIGMGVLALFEILRDRLKQSGPVAAALATAVVLIAPALMGFQNFDDHSRRLHTGARDYASNFLESCEKDAIIFTYGDNDTYPLWYAQEVEGIRTDVRVVNLSLIAVDWYIDLLRRKVNDSPPIKMTIPKDAYRGKKRNQIFVNPGQNKSSLPISEALKFIGEDHPVPTQGGGTVESYLPVNDLYIPVNRQEVLNEGVVGIQDTGRIVSRVPIRVNGSSMTKDDIAILDIIGSNLWDRPLYFAVTTQASKMFGLQDYMQLEGLSLRIIPVKSNSDQAYPGVIGSGRVNSEAVYENIMNKFRWGNFDKEELFVDRSYGPSVQSMQMAFRRAAFDLLNKRDSTKAIALANKYFESFPHKNFPYDYRSMYMLDVFFRANAYAEAKPHLEILAREVKDQLDYYTSLSEDVLRSSYNTEYQLSIQTMGTILQEVRRANDSEFLKELENLFGNYPLNNSNNPFRD